MALRQSCKKRIKFLDSHMIQSSLQLSLWSFLKLSYPWLTPLETIQNDRTSRLKRIHINHSQKPRAVETFHIHSRKTIKAKKLRANWENKNLEMGINLKTIRSW